MWTCVVYLLLSLPLLLPLSLPLSLLLSLPLPLSLYLNLYLDPDLLTNQGLYQTLVTPLSHAYCFPDLCFMHARAHAKGKRAIKAN